VLVAEDLHGGLPHPDGTRLEEVISEFGIGPVGPIQATGSRPVDDSLTQDRCQIIGQFGCGTGAFANLESVKSAFKVGVEPSLDSAWCNAQVGGDVLMWAVAVRQPDDLESIVEFAVSGAAKRVFQSGLITRGKLNANHGPGYG
jgi:hypothetical protein